MGFLFTFPRPVLLLAVTAMQCERASGLGTQEQCSFWRRTQNETVLTTDQS